MSEDTKTKVETCADCASHNTFSDDESGDLCQKCFKEYSKKDKK